MDVSQASRGLFRVEQIMGMPIGIDVRDADVDPDALGRAFDWFRRVDAIFSTYRPESEVSRLNSGVLTIEGLQPEVRSILERCEDLRVETNGYFDIWTDHLPAPLTTASGATVTSGIDPSGLVKGWSVDQAARILEEAGARNFSVNAGGDIRVCGGALPEPGWRIGIQHPLEKDQIAAILDVSDIAVATSGAYARGEHIVDPHTGQAPEGVLSVTIVGPDLATADAYATAAFAMGEAGPEWTTRLFGYEAMTIMTDKTVLTTRWFPKS